ncbi:MAG TPA: lmo0937 family membrane protein [Kofleriaceae bacterium]
MASDLQRDKGMLLILAIILAVAWVLGFAVFHVASAAIHILLILAIIGVVAHLLRGRGGTV